MLSAFPAFFLPPVSSDSAEDATKLVWVLRLRWVALSAQALCIFPALAYRLLEPRLLPRFLGVIAALTVLNLLTWNSVRKDRPARAHTYRLLIQLSFDIAALSTLLGLTGGARNPMIPLLFVHAGIGALLLPRRQSSLLFSLLLGALVLLQAFAHIPPGLQGIQVPSKILFPAQALVALVFWILTIWLSSTLSSLRQESTRAREHKTRIDRLRAVGALAAGLCHEFATPLNTAQLKLARLQRREDLGDDVDLETPSRHSISARRFSDTRQTRRCDRRAWYSKNPNSGASSSACPRAFPRPIRVSRSKSESGTIGHTEPYSRSSPSPKR